MDLPAEPRCDTLAVILAGGRGERLQPLTRDRTKAAVPFGGLYRLIDFTLSNCANSGLRRLWVLPQHNYTSLERHLRWGWDLFRPTPGEGLSVYPPRQEADCGWYRGTADAVYQNLQALTEEAPRHTLVLSCDHVYRLDYRRLVEFHTEHQAELTVACTEVSLAEARRFGVLGTDPGQRVVDFAEKPDAPRAMPTRPGRSLASMGVYVFSTRALVEALLEDARCPGSSHDFGADLLPRLVASDRRVYAYNATKAAEPGTFYWRDIGLIDAYWEASMDLLAADPPFDPWNQGWPIRTRVRPLPPARILTRSGSTGILGDVLACHGTQVVDARVQRSILSPGVRVDPGAVVVDSVLMDGVHVGAGVCIQQAIIDKNVEVPAGYDIGCDLEADAQRFQVSAGGVVVIPKGTVLSANGRGEPSWEQATVNSESITMGVC